MNKSLKDKKIAIVCDWIKDWGGAELVLSHMLEIFPQADIYTSIFYQNNNPVFRNHEVVQYEKKWSSHKAKIYTSFIQKIPFLNKSHKLALTLRPIAFESFNLSSYDIVISSTSAESKGIITKPDCLHICYCHTPTRYFWSHYHEYMSMLEFWLFNLLAKWLMPKLIWPLRKWDYIAAQRPDYFLANSHNTAKRIKKYYKREVEVLYPGIDIPAEQPLQTILRSDFYLAVGMCIPYKKFDLLIETFNKNGKKLICVTNTDNKLYRKLKSISKSNIEWKYNISRDETERFFASAKAFLFPPEEDFWLVPLEAMSYGTPVIAYGKGGALETVIANETGLIRDRSQATGVFFEEQNFESLDQAIKQFETIQFENQDIKQHAKKFSKKVFQEKLINFIEEKLKEKNLS